MYGGHVKREEIGSNEQLLEETIWLYSSQDYIKMVRDSPAPVGYNPKLADPMVEILKGASPFSVSEKQEKVTPGLRTGSPVPRRRNWNPRGEVM
jgi:hypothetical protein